MNASIAYRGRQRAASALAKAGAWLIEPLEQASPAQAIRLRPAIAVVGLAARCGTTTIARAVAAELAASDPAGAAMVAGSAQAAGLAVGSGPASRLARAVGTGDDRTLRLAGRLCLVEGGDPARLADAVRHLAPLVLDTSHGQAPGVPVSLADHTVLVASADVEPALADLVSDSLGRIGSPPIVVVNGGRAADGTERWADRAQVTVDRSRLGARLAVSGRHRPGALGEGIAELASLCEAVRSDW